MFPPGISLAFGTQYQYSSYLLGGTTWRNQVCTGANCFVLADVDIGVSSRPQVGIGGEAIDGNIGVGTTSNNEYLTSQGWLFWCYSDASSNFPFNQLVLTACDPSTHSWTFGQHS